MKSNKVIKVRNITGEVKSEKTKLYIICWTLKILIEEKTKEIKKYTRWLSTKNPEADKTKAQKYLLLGKQTEK